ncbi:hypothetical protein ACFL57_04765, partial [Candidatus Margulisiibacteriota bacterium]
MDKDKILKDIAEHYINSHDFNGIAITHLCNQEDEKPELYKIIEELIKEDKITCVFSNIVTNPHIKSFPDLSKEEQVNILHSGEANLVCAYPTSQVINSFTDITEYNNRPFTQDILCGAPQLSTKYFDIAVLERYYSDPRFLFQLRDYSGTISISDKYYESDEALDRDKTFLQTFGLGYNSDDSRVVVVFLRYLSKLSPEHQQYWNTYI